MSAPAEASPPALVGEGDLVALAIGLTCFFSLGHNRSVEALFPWVVQVCRKHAHVLRLHDWFVGLLLRAAAPPTPLAVLCGNRLFGGGWKLRLRLRLVFGLEVPFVRRDFRGRLVRLVSRRSADDRHRIGRLLG